MARTPIRRSLRQGTPEASRSRESFQFFRETIAELRRVVWPTREQATRLTILVIAISISVGIILGVMDMLFGRLFRLLI